MSSWIKPGLRIGALISFVGGPMHSADVLEKIIGKSPAFAVAITPIVLMLFGTLSIAEDEARLFPKIMAALGVIGGFAMLGQNLLMFINFANGAEFPDAGLNFFGLLLGVPIALVYPVFGIKYLRRPTVKGFI